MRKPIRILITGSGGYIGRLAVAALAADPGPVEKIVAVDIRPPAEGEAVEGVEYLSLDIRDPGLGRLCGEKRIDSIVHLVAVVSPGKKPDRAFERSVDVDGTANVIKACLEGGVGQLIVTSSGAAYGYYADNPDWLDETDAIRGNAEFAYSDHKRLVEEMLARARVEHPGLKQLILRPGTVLGLTAKNQITDLFDGKRVMGLKGAATPFVFIWDEDVVGVIKKGVHEYAAGIYNLAGDGVLTMRQIAEKMGKPYLNLPIGLVRSGLALLKMLGLTQYGPEQVNFLRYRPVLSNRRLKEEFGYIPAKTSEQVFDYFLSVRQK